jgi:hypothetical protein
LHKSEPTKCSVRPFPTVPVKTMQNADDRVCWLSFSFTMSRWKNRMNSWICAQSLVDLHVQHIQLATETVSFRSSLWTALVKCDLVCVLRTSIFTVLFLECKLYWITHMIWSVLYLLALVTEGVLFLQSKIWKIYLNCMT